MSNIRNDDADLQRQAQRCSNILHASLQAHELDSLLEDEEEPPRKSYTNGLFKLNNSCSHMDGLEEQRVSKIFNASLQADFGMESLREDFEEELKISKKRAERKGRRSESKKAEQKAPDSPEQVKKTSTRNSRVSRADRVYPKNAEEKASDSPEQIKRTSTRNSRVSRADRVRRSGRRATGTDTSPTVASPKGTGSPQFRRSATTTTSRSSQMGGPGLRRATTSEHAARGGRRGRQETGSLMAKAQLTQSLNQQPDLAAEFLAEAISDNSGNSATNTDDESQEGADMPRERPSLSRSQRADAKRRVKDDLKEGMRPQRAEGHRCILDDLLAEEDALATELATHRAKGLGSATAGNHVGPDRRTSRMTR